MTDNSELETLNRIVSALDSVVVAFSGGVDSTLLLAVCLRNLDPDAVLAVTADSPTLPRRELTEAKALAKGLGARHVIVPTEELRNECFASNPLDRCYYCKQELFAQLRALADQHGFRHVVYGATLDDLGDYRPGLRAAQDAGTMAPLLEAGFTKQDVRALSAQLGLPTSDKPAMACLASRFPYDSRITEKKLSQVEQAEELLRHTWGFSQVRVRHHGTIARIEILPSEFARLFSHDVMKQIVAQLERMGFLYVTLDLAGFRSGSMNESVAERIPATSIG